FDLAPGERLERAWILALAPTEQRAIAALHDAREKSFEDHARARHEVDAAWLAPGLDTLEKCGGEIPENLRAAYVRSLLCLPLLCGDEGVAVAAPEFDPEFISCGGYGYFWPRDGGEYVAGLMD